MYSANDFIGGASDMFLSIMLWFIFYTEKKPTVIVEGDKVYAIVDAIKQESSVSINDHEEEQEQDDFDLN